MTAKSFAPMLAVQADLDKLRYPLLASPKLDGIRCVIIGGQVLSRSLIPIPNLHVQKLFGIPELEGVDGELIVGDPTAPDVYRVTNSGVMSIDGEPDVVLFAFDEFCNPGMPFEIRRKGLFNRKAARFQILANTKVVNLDDLLDFEEGCLDDGFEGIMLRDPEGQYKFGRSTLRQGWLLKLKRFADSEAEVLSVIEQLHNSNEATKDELGHTKRSSKAEGLVPAGMMGALSVRDIHTGVEFEIGTGFTREERLDIFAQKDNYTGRLVKYQHFAGGSKDKPRFPSFRGFRDKRDL